MVERKFFKVPEVARILGVTPLTVRLWIKEGHLKARKIGAQWFISREIIDRMTNVEDPDGSRMASN